ncbi:MAG: glutaminyl-tRNA synthase (glutamine-hydrolyzing) subunit B [Candidatus Yanofskybacteria bacterium RIFCSPHIGHO2_02_FULL_44_12b]|uniref:Aspartyl/glutamyl-tRNA(Asn/Gln) amidotransferase subunit B n=3 Tax=Candidatus Yanofskyibacteriota TaxID=1752733 RepID=A0A1F8GMU9_9BACT|nr:MAG: glutaminyl-tRNA synthase (glutamine-hydrolyzing) subunit B [Candidatus Yanofskybacteria bacterium RIFCSPHIGHO2_01_FULL_44_24]OGN15341.1 MAG: glutaminyl-tRNA synthase (glutamine-hydrolyzing) subunit B [Candidatus Yanofskybacteria bacterium RIFCSPHIGHO2_02_FULL_44_12b]OGN25966.1 MAG: glutaminyl-tRNA synthase (glutamine-hydrolyzing) subunit B [Candidatus Yanofskybacteria bacterium RIFCSPLOWO2_01_FULL_44_22]
MYKPVIGLEVHAELKTKTKMFCDSLNDPDEKHPNINVCPICMGHPGTLPVINMAAIEKVITAGLALNCKIAEDTFFERKNYFYPDLPKGYQISQYQKPLCYEGYLNLQPTTNNSQSKKIRITRIHLEEDAGRLYHLPDKNYSLVDYNRAGVPLMELVTEPDFENGDQVKRFAEELQLIWRYLEVSDANMEKGQMRIEVNISLTNPDGSWGTKVEIKNINSVKFAADAVDYEIKRQRELLESGEKIKQETRGWDEFKKQSFSQRSKEEAHDYRYFPEPDLPPIRIANGRASPATGGPPTLFSAEKIRSEMPELPQQRRERFVRQYGLPGHDVEMFTVNKPLGDYFEHVASELLSFDRLDHLKKPDPEHQGRLLKLASNYVITELKRMADSVGADPADTKISPEMFADLVVRVFHSEVSSSGAQTVLKEMFATGFSPGQIIKEKNLEQVSNVEDLNSAVAKVITDNPKAVEDFKAGKEASIRFLVGMAMRETKGKANPQVVEGILKGMLK